jgi:hypothetical protein
VGLSNRSRPDLFQNNAGSSSRFPFALALQSYREATREYGIPSCRPEVSLVTSYGCFAMFSHRKQTNTIKILRSVLSQKLEEKSWNNRKKIYFASESSQEKEEWRQQIGNNENMTDASHMDELNDHFHIFLFEISSVSKQVRS